MGENPKVIDRYRAGGRREKALGKFSDYLRGGSRDNEERGLMVEPS